MKYRGCQSIDKIFPFLYDKNMKKIAVIGGGAAGMACAVLLARAGHDVTILERGARLGRKLSASGNGQGNVTNIDMGKTHYFTDDAEKLARILEKFGAADAVAFLEGMGGIFLPDARGRVYPASRQASSVTDLFRRELSRLGVRICLGAQVKKLAYDKKTAQFSVGWAEGHMQAEAVVLAAGGKAAKNFGTDGTAYALAQAFGHTVTPLSPSLVQLRTSPAAVRGLKGVRTDALLTVEKKGAPAVCFRGDVLFTESGVSGDAVFRASSYAEAGDILRLDLLPDVPASRLVNLREEGDLLCVLHSALARHIARLSRENGKTLSVFVKNFPLEVTGTLGFDYAQVTRGGIPLAEADGFLMSKLQPNFYFAGEILNVDGECGGYNLHWAFASAHAVAEALS